MWRKLKMRSKNMKKRHYLVAAMCLMTLASCTQKTELPENPKDKEEYRDSQGNSWIYNAMLMRWALMPSAMNRIQAHGRMPMVRG